MRPLPLGVVRGDHVTTARDRNDTGYNAAKKVEKRTTATSPEMGGEGERLAQRSGWEMMTRERIAFHLRKMRLRIMRQALAPLRMHGSARASLVEQAVGGELGDATYCSGVGGIENVAVRRCMMRSSKQEASPTVVSFFSFPRRSLMIGGRTPGTGRWLPDIINSPLSQQSTLGVACIPNNNKNRTRHRSKIISLVSPSFWAKTARQVGTASRRGKSAQGRPTPGMRLRAVPTQQKVVGATKEARPPTCTMPMSAWSGVVNDAPHTAGRTRVLSPCQKTKIESLLIGKGNRQTNNSRKTQVRPSPQESTEKKHSVWAGKDAGRSFHPITILQTISIIVAGSTTDEVPQVYVGTRQKHQ